MQSIALWIIFLIGQLVALIMRADTSAACKFTPWMTIRQYMAANLGLVVGKTFVASLLFWVWWHDPALLSLLGVDASKLPLNCVTAGLYGMVSDKIAEYVLIKITKLITPGA